MKTKQKRAYRYRVYPTEEQKWVLVHTFGCVRFVYNWALRLRKQAYLNEQKSISYGETSALLTKLKQQPDYSWLNEVSCVPPQQALRHLERAFKNFFAGHAKYPIFKKKHRSNPPNTLPPLSPGMEHILRWRRWTLPWTSGGVARSLGAASHPPSRSPGTVPTATSSPSASKRRSSRSQWRAR